jgi:hypothetical protein
MRRKKRTGAAARREVDAILLPTRRTWVRAGAVGHGRTVLKGAARQQGFVQGFRTPVQNSYMYT